MWSRNGIPRQLIIVTFRVLLATPLLVVEDIEDDVRKELKVPQSFGAKEITFVDRKICQTPRYFPPAGRLSVR